MASSYKKVELDCAYIPDFMKGKDHLLSEMIPEFWELGIFWFKYDGKTLYQHVNLHHGGGFGNVFLGRKSVNGHEFTKYLISRKAYWHSLETSDGKLDVLEAVSSRHMTAYMIAQTDHPTWNTMTSTIGAIKKKGKIVDANIRDYLMFLPEGTMPKGNMQNSESDLEASLQHFDRIVQQLPECDVKTAYDMIWHQDK